MLYDVFSQQDGPLFQVTFHTDPSDHLSKRYEGGRENMYRQPQPSAEASQAPAAMMARAIRNTGLKDSRRISQDSSTPMKGATA